GLFYFYHANIFNNTVIEIKLTSVVTSIALETISGSVSNSMAYIAAEAALGIADITRITPPTIGSSCNTVIKPNANNGEINIRIVTADVSTCQLNCNDFIFAGCIPKIIIINGIEPSLTILIVLYTPPGSSTFKPLHKKAIIAAQVPGIRKTFLIPFITPVEPLEA